MGKTFLKTGKVVVLLNGRYAGKKAVIVKSFDGTKTRHYGHCLVAGVRRCPRRITKAMTKKEILRRTSMRPFVKVINWNHMMPTRYTFDTENMARIMRKRTDDAGQRLGGQVKQQLRTIFETRYRAGKNLWFFSKLRF